MDVKLLSAICETSGAPGYESKIRNLILKEIEGHADQIEIDNMGNIVALKKGKENKKAMVAAHMDEIAFMVTHIDDEGFLRFTSLGGFDPKTLTAQRVIVHGKEDLIGVMGSKPIHLMTPEEREKAPKLTDFFIDLGLSGEIVKDKVKIGDVVTRERKLIEMGNCVNCKSLDNRVSVYILIEALKQLNNPPYDVYAVFTVQEEVGIRGAQAATLKINPDFGFGLDTTIAYDVPGSKAHEQVTRLGKGTAIKIMDASVICDYRMVDYMKKTAEKHQIKWQPEILVAGGTDTSGLQKMTAGGSIAGAVSIPTRHIHQVIEMVDKSDVDASVGLLVACLNELHLYDWKHQ
ncbi:MAG: M42 family metallopeptidase [Flavobacteriales bacterium]